MGGARPSWDPEKEEDNQGAPPGPEESENRGAEGNNGKTGGGQGRPLLTISAVYLSSPADSQSQYSLFKFGDEKMGIKSVILSLYSSKFSHFAFTEKREKRAHWCYNPEASRADTQEAATRRVLPAGQETPAEETAGGWCLSSCAIKPQTLL